MLPVVKCVAFRLPIFKVCTLPFNTVDKALKSNIRLAIESKSITKKIEYSVLTTIVGCNGIHF